MQKAHRYTYILVPDGTSLKFSCVSCATLAERSLRSRVRDLRPRDAESLACSRCLKSIKAATEQTYV